jgi:glycosyltransferase involved in cell wall biosynthesis
VITQLLAHIGVYVHGHSVGGTNPAPLQALGAGEPCPALDTPFNREVLRAPDQVYPRDAAALAAQIRTTLDDPSRRQAWALRGRETIHARYQWRGVFDAYERALRDAMPDSQ